MPTTREKVGSTAIRSPKDCSNSHRPPIPSMCRHTSLRPVMSSSTCRQVGSGSRSLATSPDPVLSHRRHAHHQQHRRGRTLAAGDAWLMGDTTWRGSQDRSHLQGGNEGGHRPVGMMARHDRWPECRGDTTTLNGRRFQPQVRWTRRKSDDFEVDDAAIGGASDHNSGRQCPGGR